MMRNLKKETAEFVFVGFMLSLLAGYVNVYMLRYFDSPVSHLTGAFSYLPIDVIEKKHHHLIGLLLLIPGFFIGAVLSSFVINQSHYIPGKRYGLVLILEGCGLFITDLLVLKHIYWALFTGALSCGLQNAMASLYRGMIIRTTHVTGLITDLGILLGKALHGHKTDRWKFALDVSLVFGFLLGGFVAVLLPDALRQNGLIVPSLFCLSLGTAYFMWRKFHFENVRAKRQNANPF
ncbi:protein of unknown function DUF1275 [Chloroherpeton thalassium ATCC 35110]|uniref:DUF1275 domain-containing protein n=1 Tax=Chloroherpeton thalassium (strain ATCC 35110 / GB-78) TaxID=517418 RepID=B3QST0_CHLT3|nr:YoaK family protein [Chloroherpeton thalassium]ACF14127.1 protein of unknown function DUF1275 [Chloroherpeton thalassium ATCC 35110]